MSFPFRLRFAAAAAFTAAIAASPAALAQPALPVPSAPVQAPSASDDLPTGLSADLFYRLLLGDIALQRGDAALAARAYLEVAQELKDVPMLLPQAPEGLIASGEGRERSYIYAENAAKEKPAEEEAQEAVPLPKPDLSVPPAD